MGIGLVVVVAADEVEAALGAVEGACVMGRIVETTSEERVELI
jgi:phosphoribosylaminoimidazole (AIR) synthetase